MNIMNKIDENKNIMNKINEQKNIEHRTMNKNYVYEQEQKQENWWTITITKNKGRRNIATNKNNEHWAFWRMNMNKIKE